MLDQSYVITIMDNPKSKTAATRCAASAAGVGLACDYWPATTPNDNLHKLFDKENIPGEGFVEKYSRLENCMAAFFSHYSLWKHCVATGKELTVFEHDAVVMDSISKYLNYQGCISLGRPSYGRYNDPLKLGVNPLTSKRYFPGAHAYRVNPWGAEQLIAQAKVAARPTDVFLHVDTFPWLEEYYPWPVEALDTFTTIQKTEGCLAKHHYGKDYEII